jgi:hypothetical protein
MIEEVFIVTLDESLMEYQPSAKIKTYAEKNEEPIPIVYIPRKSHSNELLVYIAATYIDHPIKSNSKIPFIIDLLSHLQVDDVSNGTALEQIMNR